jgi:probable F420-dependent oxidoreductase
MRFGLALPHYDFSSPDGDPVSFRRVLDATLRAEQLGFDSVWISDHFFLSLARYGGGDAPRGSLEPLTTLAALAVRTERIRLGTLVLSAPFRHPSVLAKMATAIDLYSGGRFDLGIGAGWYEEEFAAFGYEYGSTGGRFDLLEETVEVLALLFGEGPASFRGERFSLDGAYNRPFPESGRGPALWIGSKGGPRSLRLAARRADGWNTAWRWSIDDYAERVAESRRICESEGRDPHTLRLSIGLYMLLGEDARDVERRYEALVRWTPGDALDDQPLEEFARGALVGTREEVREILAELAELGVEEVIVSPASLPFAVYDDTMTDLFAATFIERTRAA